MRRRGLLAGLLLGGAGVVLVGVLAFSARGASRSTEDRGPDGVAALAGVLERIGYRVQGLRLGLHVLPRAEADALVLLSPPGLVAWPPLVDADAGYVLDFAAAGHLVVHATDRQDRLLDRLEVSYDPHARPRSEVADRTVASPTRPGLWTRSGPITVAGRGGLVGEGLQPLYTAAGAVVGGVVRVGRGEVLVLADPTLPANGALGDPGNLDLLVHALGERVPPGGVVAFDDLHAGGGDDHGVIAYARRAGAGGALLAASLLVLLILWRLTARDVAPSVAAPEPPTGGAAAYVRGLADLYERADLAPHALAVSSRSFRRAVEERAGVAWEREALGRWLRDELGDDASADFQAVRSAFARLFEQEAPAVDEVLAAAQLAARFESRWLGARAPRRRDRYAAPSPRSPE